MTDGQPFLEDLQNKVSQDKEVLLQELRQSPTGYAWCRSHSTMADNVWQILLREMVRLYPGCPPVSLAATGGYGREELSPHSDIDVTLVPLTEDSELEHAVKWLFRAADQVIRNGLGLRLAYVYRLPSEVVGLDDITLSNLLDLRLVAGSPEPTRKLEEALYSEFPAGPFILAKIEERRRDMAATHQTPLVVEPDLKRGAGGLRCHHTGNWIGQAVGERPAPLPPEVDQILLVRNLLHLVTDRHHDLLNRQRRQDVAQILGLDPADLGSSLAHALAQNHERYLEGLRRIHEARFPINEGAKAVRGELRIEPGCSVTSAALAVDVATRLGLLVTPDSPPLEHQNDPRVLNAFRGGESTVRNLDRSGVLNSLLPELAACKALMPSDASHRFTVYEHTVVALRNLLALPPDTPLGQISAQVKNIENLVLALLLHDTGKIDSTRPHSETGAEKAALVCSRWGLDRNRTEQIVWLVREHLAMSKFVRMRDVMQPDTAQDFAKIVGDDQRLHMLALLTYADVKAVNDEIWTPVQEQLLLELHHRTLALLNSQDPATPDEAKIRRQMVRRQRLSEIPDDLFAAFLDSLPAHYVLGTDSDTAQIHYNLVESARKGEIEVMFEDNPWLGVTEMAVAAVDTPRSLTKILGVLYAFEVKILGLRVSTTATDPPVLLDTFTLTSANKPLTPRLAMTLRRKITAVLQGDDVDAILREHGKDPERRQEVFQLNIVPKDPLIVEVRAPRGRGLAYRLARVLAELDLNIVAARLGQWAGSASAAFYVHSRDGRPVDVERLKDGFAANPVNPSPADTPQVSSNRPVS